MADKGMVKRGHSDGLQNPNMLADVGLGKTTQRTEKGKWNKSVAGPLLVGCWSTWRSSTRLTGGPRPV